MSKCAEKIRFVGRGTRGVSLSTYVPVYPYPLNETREIFKGRVEEKREKENKEGGQQQFRCVTGRKKPMRCRHRGGSGSRLTCDDRRRRKSWCTKL